MTSRKKIILVGGGGHCLSCIDVIESTGCYSIVGILDVPEKVGEELAGYSIVGTDEDIPKWHAEDYCFLITAGQIKSADLRKELFLKLKSNGAQIETIIASTARVSRLATVGVGSIVMHNTVVNAGSVIHTNCIINTGATIEHGATVGDHTHISTGATVNGDALVGSESFIGSSACIANGVKLVDRVVVGASALVLNHIEEQGTYIGVPVKKIN